MRTLRIYYPNLASKKVGNKFALYDEADIKHLKVLRVDRGDYNFEVGDGLGTVGKATLLQLTKEGVLFSLDELTLTAVNTTQHILVLPIIKPANLEIAIDQAVQFDLYSHILLYFSDYSRLSKQEISANKVKRFEKIALEAYKQSKALYLPAVEVSGTLSETLEILKQLEVESTLVPDLTVTEDSWDSARSKLSGKIALVIGPEGGFSEKERKLLQSAPQPTFFQLGNSILTTEAASTAFSALVKSYNH